MNYDANIFCEIIESIQGIKFLRQEESFGFQFRFYEGLRGLVIIDYDNDNFTDNTGKGYLVKLGLEHLIISMYPDTITNIEPEQHSVPQPKTAQLVTADNPCPHCDGIGKIGSDLSGQCLECEGTGTAKAV